MQSIASPRNPLLKEVRKALLRGTLTESGCAVAETFHLLEEALRSDCHVPFVLAAESVHTTVERHVRNLNGVRLVVVADSIFDQVAATESTQGVIALVKPPVFTFDQVLRGRTLLVVLDGIQDPGNAGTIVRGAEAFGATGVVFLKGSVSPYNAKTLRASAGSMFRLPFVHSLEADFVLTALSQRRLDLYAAVPGSARQVHDIDFTRRCALVIGSEGRGVSEKLRSASIDVSIPTTGVESLNAAIAASVILYEASRQRRSAGAAV